MSGRRSNFITSISDSCRRYQAREKCRERATGDAEIITLSCAHPRYGYRLIQALGRLQGHQWNHKRVWRLRRLAQLSVAARKAYKRKYGAQNRKMTAIKPNSIWAFDFVHDECANGQKLKCFVVKDEFTRECLAIDVESRFRAAAVVNTLNRLICIYGRPAYLRCDNGPEFIAKQVRKWATSKNIEIAYTEPGKPWQNGSIESFNSRFRDECLNMEWFASRREARVIIQTYRERYNSQRPHSAINYRVPSEVRMTWQNRHGLADTDAA